jgi:hypothetical protein
MRIDHAALRTRDQDACALPVTLVAVGLSGNGETPHVVPVLPGGAARFLADPAVHAALQAGRGAVAVCAVPGDATVILAFGQRCRSGCVQ